MAEPTLALKLKDLQAKLGVFAGWGRGSLFSETAWTTQQQAIIDDATQSGLRCFYYPEVVHDWTFLHPTATIILAEGETLVSLPDDYAGLDSDLTLVTTSATTIPLRIRWKDEGVVRKAFSLAPTVTGPPQMVTVRPIKGTTINKGQRFELLFFPEADDDYTMQFQYTLNPDYITTTLPYALGGAQHTETVLESCLAAMENRLDDAMTVHTIRFKERMAASIAMDKKNRPLQLGYNYDRSDETHGGYYNPHWFGPPSTYNGADWD